MAKRAAAKRPSSANSTAEADTGHKADLDIALVALSQASALLEFAIESKLSDIHPEIVQQGLWGIHSEIDRARVALNGENEIKPREQWS